MPELPEIETACRGIAPHITGQTICSVDIRNPKLRWPVPVIISETLRGELIHGVSRRGKYILLEFGHGHLILHLGMSGSLRILPSTSPPTKHDHVDMAFNSGICLRYTDPRRFGSIHWTTADPFSHNLLKGLGPEPLQRGFHGKYLFNASRNKTRAVKTFIMDSHVVVGVGNIYANEALFMSGIHPATIADAVSLDRYMQLALCIKSTLRKAIKKGGTTLRDFVNSDGNPGYFQQTLSVYGRKDQPCKLCGCPIRAFTLNQRASYYCQYCQR